MNVSIKSKFCCLHPFKKSLLISFLLIVLHITGFQNLLAQGELWGMTPAGGSSGLGVIFKLNPDGSNYTVKHQFSSSTAGSNPYYCQLVEGINGKLYGMTHSGGTYNQGVLFEYDYATGQHTNKVVFDGTNGGSPYGSMMAASNGKLYGMCGGGPQGRGVLFEYDVITSTYTIRYFFSDLNVPGSSKLVEGPNGKMYGMSHASIFSFDLATFTYTKEANITGSIHGELLLASNNIFYGITEKGGINDYGTLFQFDPATGIYTKKKDFGRMSDGTYVHGIRPSGGLAQAANGKLYGVTQGGGVYGTLFEYDIATDIHTLKVQFNPALGISGIDSPESGLIVASNGNLYGLTENIWHSTSSHIIEFNPTTNVFGYKSIADAAWGRAKGTLVQASNGKLYGMTYNGGNAGRGMIFEYDPATRLTTGKTSFDLAPNGSRPTGTLTQAFDGKLYGLTSEGGVHNYGVIFSIHPSTGAYSKIIDIGPSNGSRPYGTMTLHPDGNLYGLTAHNNLGTVFQFNPTTGQITNSTSFNDQINGREPYGSLALAPTGKFYGMTKLGGTKFEGVIFEYDPATNKLTKKIDLTWPTGAYPYGDLTLAPNGKFYGMTSQGGSHNLGVIFEYDYVLNKYTPKVNFTNDNGAAPTGSLVAGPNGTLFGMTQYGSDGGRFFEFDPISGEIGFDTYVALTDEQGTVAMGSLAKAADGKLYGMASLMGANKAGTLFKFNPATMWDPEPAEYYINHFFHFDYVRGARPLYNPLMVIRLPQTISVANASITKTYGDAEFAISASSNSGLPLSFVSSDPTVALVKNNNMISIVGAGTASIEILQIGNGDYLPAQKKLVTLTVNKAVLQAKADNKVKVFGQPNPSLTITYTGFFGSDSPTLLAQAAAVSTVAGLASDAGTYPITLTGGLDENYTLVLTNGELQITKADQLITFNAIPSKTILEESFILDASTTSGLPLSYASSNTSVAQINGNVVEILAAGSTTITVSQAGNHNYNPAANKMQMLTVTKASQTISFSPLPLKTIFDEPFTLNGVASSGLEVTYTSSNTTVAQVNGNTVEIVGTGSAVITASQGGDFTYDAAESKMQTLIVNKATQLITFPPLEDKTLGEPSFLLNAQSSSGLPITYSPSSDNITIVNSEVTLEKAGRTIIFANQNGNPNFDAALPVSQSFCINPEKPIVTITSDAGAPVLISSSNSHNQWYLGDVAVSEATEPIFHPAVQGTYKVRISVDDCKSDFSENISVIITGLESDPNKGSIIINPNPVEDIFEITGIKGQLQKVELLDLAGRPTSFSLESGPETYHANVQHLKAGVYMLLLYQSWTVHYVKIVKR